MVDVAPDDDQEVRGRQSSHVEGTEPSRPHPSEPARTDDDLPEDDMLDAVTRKAQRRQDARREGKSGLASGFGMFGLVGWSVTVPTLAGIALGVWIDRTTKSQYSWTLMLMIAGLAVGSFNAWYWVRKEMDSD